MEFDLSIIIAHYNPNVNLKNNPLHKTLETISNQCSNFKIEIIIADDGSLYSTDIIEDYAEQIRIKNDIRSLYILENHKLNQFLKKIKVSSNLISKWVFLSKSKKCMSKARVTNFATKIAKSKNILFLDDDNYLISNYSIKDILNLFLNYNFIVGQIRDNNGRLRSYNSKRVQGTTIGMNKDIFFQIGGLGEWTEEFSCGIDSDLWIRLYNYFNKNRKLKACYTNKLSSYDSYSKRWKKYTPFFRDYFLKKKFNEKYKIKNYKNAKHNLSRNKNLWIENLIDE